MLVLFKPHFFTEENPSEKLWGWSFENRKCSAVGIIDYNEVFKILKSHNHTAVI